MPRLSLLGILVIALSFNGLMAQPESTKQDESIKKSNFKPLDSLRYYVNKRNGRFLLGLDGRNSYINGTSAPVLGIRYGLSYDKISLYTGFYSSRYFSRSKEDTLSVDYGYIATSLEYYLVDKWRYDLYVPMAVGYCYSRICWFDCL